MHLLPTRPRERSAGRAAAPIVRRVRRFAEGVLRPRHACAGAVGRSRVVGAVKGPECGLIRLRRDPGRGCVGGAC